ncbi:MAG TPA: FAD-dependent oxidoreductase [Ideonella sp.]|nr:FAD-dependent oxidoreductase [Ideonella sp.]
MKRLVLLGAGHAHLHVLREFARRPPPDARITLVSPHARTLYSGMVPGFVAGHYRLDDCAIPIAPLIEGSPLQWRRTEALAIDADARRVRLADGESIGYDALSVDTGATMSRAAIAGSAEHGLFVRPLERFVALWQALLRCAEQRYVCVVVVGGGAAGFELALAARHALAGRAHVSLVTGGVPLLASHARAARARAQRTLARRGVLVFDAACTEVRATQVVLEGGLRLACDAALLAIGAAAPDWLAGSGLALDGAGFVATRPTLQSASHPEVFAAGDVAARADAPRPRSGVYAVRAGPPLARNLRRWLADEALAPWTPQSRSLNLLSCGAREAIACWGPFALQGRWAWWWKDRIDRGFVAGYRRR